jgi:hypothetical protein
MRDDVSFCIDATLLVELLRLVPYDGWFGVGVGVFMAEELPAIFRGSHE